MVLIQVEEAQKAFLLMVVQEKLECFIDKKNDTMQKRLTFL